MNAMSQQHIRCTLSLLVSLIAAIPLTAAEAQSAESATPSAEVATADSLPELPARDSLRPRFISVRYDQGKAFKTNDFMKENGTKLGYQAMAVKYGFGQPGNSWEHLAHHKGYNGIGFYVAHFDDARFGNPISLFAFHGGNLIEFSQRAHLQYEWNFGYSTEWRHYDAFHSPDNITIGSRENFHIGANLFLEWQFTRHFDLKVGAGLTHFSNAARNLPNKGMNLFSPMVELAYRWDDPSYTFGNLSTQQVRDLYGLNRPAEFGAYHPRRFKHQLNIVISHRQKYMDTTGSGLPNEYYDHDFRVLGLSYAPMVIPCDKFAYGPSLDVVYDESNNATVRRERNTTDGYVYDRLLLGPVSDRFQVGLSMKGELKLPYFTYFGQLGYDLKHADDATSRLYQILGVEGNVTRRLFFTAGIRSIRFSKAQFCYWSIGYNIM
jgi:hypothetical protein